SDWCAASIERSAEACKQAVTICLFQKNALWHGLCNEWRRTKAVAANSEPKAGSRCDDRLSQKT
ncbi:MAG: hypothetical protein P8090_10730, partial [Gammaproteobacteria bacterium]